MELTIVLLREKDILILNKGPTQGLDDTTLTGEGEYSIKFSDQIKETFLKRKPKWKQGLFTSTKICQFKVKYSRYMNMCISFSVDYDNIDTDDVLDIYKYLIKKA